ncbi:MAG: hypothetical protein GX558_01550 [Clostridiales bacterium]|nr:hypothetical protein [Clostridiales bacterium]
MDNLSQLLSQLTALVAMSAVAELALPSGGLKQGVRLIAGLLTAGWTLRLALSLPALFGA